MPPKMTEPTIEMNSNTANIRVYSGPLSMFGAKSVIALLEKGLDFDLLMVPFNSDDRYDPKHPEVLRINPKGQVPVLTHGEVEIYDSTQIFEYLEDICPQPRLWPASIDKRARARQLEHQADEVYFPHVIRLMSLQDKLASPDAQAAIHACQNYYVGMEEQLGDQEYLCGELSCADIAFFMAQLFGERMSAPMTDATPALRKWRTRMLQRPAVQQGVSPLISHLTSANRPVPDFLAIV
jgi:glutathione S-transferase